MESEGSTPFAGLLRTSHESKKCESTCTQHDIPQSGFTRQARQLGKKRTFEATAKVGSLFAAPWGYANNQKPKPLHGRRKGRDWEAAEIRIGRYAAVSSKRPHVQRKACDSCEQAASRTNVNVYTLSMTPNNLALPDNYIIN